MLQLVLGPSGSGKTSLLYARIRALAQQGEKSILLVPEQFTSSTEGRIWRTLGDAGAGMVESLSFTALAERVLGALGGSAVKTLTDAGRAVLVRRAAAALGGELAYYSRSRRSAAFCVLAAQTIDELKSAGLTPEALRALAPGCGAERDKIAELALIYGAYEALLARTAMDPTDRLTLAADRLEAAAGAGELPDFLAGRHIFVDEFDTFNAPKKRLMGALLAAAPDVTAALCADGADAPAPGDLSLFSGGRRVAAALKELARRAGAGVAVPQVLAQDLRHAAAPGLAALGACLAREDALPAPEQRDPAEIRLYPAADREEEARAAAAAIRHLVRAGARYRSIAVVCRDPAAYRAAVRYEFRLAGIPLFCDEATTPEFSAPACAVRALLQILRGADYGENLVALAKTGLAGLTERQICALDNYVYTWAPRAAEWRAEFARSPQGFGESSRVTAEEKQDVAEAEAARARLVPPVEHLRAAAKGMDAAALSRALYLCLRSLGAEESQAALVAALRETQGIPAAEEAAREWNVIMDLLNQMALLVGGDVLAFPEYAELFELLARTSDLGHIPETLDAVIFTSAGKMRLDAPDYVFVLGLGEGEFPAAPADTGLLTHADRDALMAQDVELPDCFENRAVREQICFYKAMTAPARGLWLSWPAGLGQPLTSALEPLAEAFAFRAPALCPEDYAATPAAALDRLGSVWSLGDAQGASLYAALRARPEAAPALAALERAAAAAPERVTRLDTMAQVLGPRLHLSPSQMEKYYNCRYSYFLQYVLGLRPRRKAQLTPDQSGSLMHWVLQMALDPAGGCAAVPRPAPFAELTNEQATAYAAALTEEYVRLYMPDDTARFAYLVRRMKRSLAGLLCYIRDEQRQSGFHPVACEAQIGTGAGCLPPQVYALPGGRTVEVVGTIDRVDEWRDGEGRRWVRVVDYKTGVKAFDLKDVYCGLDCQMLLYLFTLTRDESGRFTGAQPAGVLYLLADPSPKQAERDAPPPVAPYALDGLVRDDPAVYTAMDAGQTGAYLPFGFQNGKPAARQRAKLADAEKLARIGAHLDGLVRQMGEGLYAGEIAAEPLYEGSSGPCDYCEYGLICCREKGETRREKNAPADPFGAEQDPAPHAEKEAEDLG